MTLFRRRPDDTERRWADPSAIPPNGSLAAWGASAGPVNTERAMRFSAVWAAHNLIVDQVSMLPVDEYRKATDGAAVELAPSRLVTDPSAVVDAMTWRYQAISSMLLSGAAAGVVTGVSSAGWPEQIELIDARSLDWKRPSTPGGEWTVRLLGKDIKRWPEGPLWYVPGRTLPGSPVGLSVIAYAASRIGLGLSAEKFGSEWFDNGAHPSAILQSDQEIGDTAATVLKRRFKEAARGREVVAMGLGARYQPISVPANESQFLETIQASVADIARFFGMQPEMIGGSPGAGSSITYANIEQRFLHLRQVTLAPWIVRLERALTALTPRPRYIKLNRDAAVAMDLTTRVRAIDVQVRNGTLSRDEARRLDDRPPIPDGTGGEFFIPAGTTPDADVPIEEPAEPRAVVRRVEHDDRGRISRIIEEVA